MNFTEAHKIAKEEFANRVSMMPYPLRDTHVNDVPVIAAELMVQATKNQQEKIEKLRKALKAIMKHQKIVGGSMARFSTTREIAEEALKDG